MNRAPQLSNFPAVGDRKASFAGRFDPAGTGQGPTQVVTEPNAEIRIERAGLSLRLDSRRVHHHADEGSITLFSGRPAVAGRALPSARDIAAAIQARGVDDWSWLRGRFALIHIDLAGQRMFLLADRFAVHPVCYAHDGSAVAFADRADSVPVAGARELDPQAIYDYAYFHMIPAPRTVFKGVTRLEAAQVVSVSASGVAARFFWQPRFEPVRRNDVDALAEEFRNQVRGAVERQLTTDRLGAFLSGGTDSSTVAGFAARLTGRKVPTFSIGFDAEGYDEMEYARTAARHFGTDQHEYYITPDDLVRSIPDVAAFYDQPFGNSSALPAYYCAGEAVRAGIEKMLAGDGGDELFGGNTRYAKQKVFDAYQRVPAALRGALLEPLLVNGLARSLPIVKKAGSYVEQARVPMPDRSETYNLLARFGAAHVFAPGFMRGIDVGAPLALQRLVYGRQSAGSLVDRMLAYDWRFTLADNDLPKVVGTTTMAGIDVGFPFLDDDLVDFSARLHPDLKLRGLTLRYFFKEALRGFLPDAIIQKKKHGFGLPFGPWLVRSDPLRRLAQDALQSLVRRRIVRAEFVAELFSTRLQEHAGYFGEMIWILMMLEHWLAANASAFAAD